MGLFFAILASVLYGINPTYADFILKKGVTALEVSIIASLLVSIYSLIMCKLKHTSLKIKKEECLPLIICGIASFSTNVLLGNAYIHIPVGFATMIHFIYPTIVFLTCVILYKEKITSIKIISIILCLLGLYLISGTSGSINITGVIFAICSAFTYSIYLVVSDKSSIGTLPSQKFTLYVGLFGASSGLIFKCTTYPVFSNYSGTFLLFIATSLMLFGGAFFLNKSIKLIGANKASAFTVVEPLTSLIFSSLISHYPLSLSSILGCICILIALILSSI